jgi:hypothetical protein
MITHWKPGPIARVTLFAVAVVAATGLVVAVDTGRAAAQDMTDTELLALDAEVKYFLDGPDGESLTAPLSVFIEPFRDAIDPGLAIRFDRRATEALSGGADEEEQRRLRDRVRYLVRRGEAGDISIHAVVSEAGPGSYEARIAFDLELVDRFTRSRILWSDRVADASTGSFVGFATTPESAADRALRAFAEYLGAELSRVIANPDRYREEREARAREEELAVRPTKVEAEEEELGRREIERGAEDARRREKLEQESLRADHDAEVQDYIAKEALHRDRWERDRQNRRDLRRLREKYIEMTRADWEAAVQGNRRVITPDYRPGWLLSPFRSIGRNGELAFLYGLPTPVGHTLPAGRLSVSFVGQAQVISATATEDGDIVRFEEGAYQGSLTVALGVTDRLEFTLEIPLRGRRGVQNIWVSPDSANFPDDPSISMEPVNLVFGEPRLRGQARFFETTIGKDMKFGFGAGAQIKFPLQKTGDELITTKAMDIAVMLGADLWDDSGELPRWNANLTIGIAALAVVGDNYFARFLNGKRAEVDPIVYYASTSFSYLLFHWTEALVSVVGQFQLYSSPTVNVAAPFSAVQAELLGGLRIQVQAWEISFGGGWVPTSIDGGEGMVFASLGYVLDL